MNRRSLLGKIAAGIAGLFGGATANASELAPKVKPTLRWVEPETKPPLPDDPNYIYGIESFFGGHWECSVHGDITCKGGTVHIGDATLCLACATDKLIELGVAHTK